MNKLLIGAFALALLAGCSSNDENAAQDAAAAAAMPEAYQADATSDADDGDASASAALAAADSAALAADAAAGDGDSIASFPMDDDDREEDEPTVDPYAQWQREDEERRRSEIRDARERVLAAQDDLNRSVRRLSDNDWENDLPTVKRRLRDLEEANQQLGSVDYNASSSMDFEISRMKRETRRLDDENWRDVVPDLERRNRSISFEADMMQSSSDE